MTTLIWIVPATVVISLLALIFRRLISHFLRISHLIVLIMSVISATGCALAVTSSVAPPALTTEIDAAILIAGLMIGILLTAREFRRPYKG